MANEFLAGALATVPGVVAVVELFMRLPIGEVLGELRGTSAKSIKVVASSRISDHWKEKATRSYSLIMLKGSCRLFVYLVALLAAFCAAYGLAGVFLFAGVEQGLAQLLDIKTQFVAVAVGVLYGFTRKRLRNV